MQLLTVSRSEAEKVYIVVYNAEGAELTQGEVVRWTHTTTAAYQGVAVELVDAVVAGTSGIAGKVAGVVDSTIATAAVGRLQIYGPGNVRASASLNVAKMVVASSINATNIGHVCEHVPSTDGDANMLGAVVGWTLENGPNATNSTVQISCF